MQATAGVWQGPQVNPTETAPCWTSMGPHLGAAAHGRDLNVKPRPVPVTLGWENVLEGRKILSLGSKDG